MQSAVGEASPVRCAVRVIRSEVLVFCRKKVSHCMMWVKGLSRMLSFEEMFERFQVVDA